MKQFHWLKLLPLDFHRKFSMLNFPHNSSVRQFSRIIEWEEGKPKNNVNSKNIDHTNISPLCNIWVVGVVGVKGST